MDNNTRIRVLAIFSLLFNVGMTTIAIAYALDPSENAAWLSWGYIQKGCTLLSIMLFLPLWRLSMKTFFDTFPDDDIPELSPNTKVSSLIQAELDRVTRNPRIPGAQQ